MKIQILEFLKLASTNLWIFSPPFLVGVDVVLLCCNIVIESNPASLAGIKELCQIQSLNPQSASNLQHSGALEDCMSKDESMR